MCIQMKHVGKRTLKEWGSHTFQQHGQKVRSAFDSVLFLPLRLLLCPGSVIFLKNFMNVYIPLLLYHRSKLSIFFFIAPTIKCINLRVQFDGFWHVTIAQIKIPTNLHWFFLGPSVRTGRAPLACSIAHQISMLVTVALCSAPQYSLSGGHVHILLCSSGAENNLLLEKGSEQ